MKRGAERQISKGEDDPEDIEEISGDTSFSKADDAVLATRKIKGMPRRMAGSPSPFNAPSPDSALTNGAAENPATPPPSKFSSFGGFGSPASSGNPFAFTPPSASPSFPPAKATTSLFGPPGGSPSPSTLFSAGPPALAPTASNAAKTFASFLGGDSSSKPAANSTPPPPPKSNTSAFPAESDAVDDAALKYYTSLRGLNVSILAAITKAIDQDPFTDVAGLLARYSSLRVDVQKEFDSSPKPDAPAARSSAPSPSPFGPPQPLATPAAPPAKMPAAPVIFAGFGKTAKAAAPPPKTNGIADAPPAPPANPFSFGSSSSSSTSTAPKPSVFAPSASPFGSSTSTPSAFGSAPSSSLFGTTSTASPFGNTASPFGNTASPFGTATSPSPSASPFGAPKAAMTSLFGGAGGFGSSASPFGGGGSIGNPVGFGFGSPKGAGSPAPEEPSKETTGEDAADGEASGSGSQETDKASTPGATEEGASEPATGSGTGMLFGAETQTGMDAEGEGEEDEETVHFARIKAYRMRRKEEGGDGGWLDIGLGILRLKKHKETSARRLLLRNSHSGKIQINFALYSGLKASHSKKSLTFVGHDETGEPQTYSLRFRSEEAAKEFNTFLEQEVAAVNTT
ncbi:hypothetical protein DFH09DRAFT_1359617 [Mycena vulgaris]|nr:hypothetical protein DFH09DRAFT_1359617 [Mycena vulgaris]